MHIHIPQWLVRLMALTGASAPQYQILSPASAAKFLEKDTDGYVQSLTTADLIARNVKTIRAYRASIVEAAGTTKLTPEDTQRIILAAQLADAYFRDKVREIDGKVVAAMPWKIVVIDGDAYEEGLPHTRADIVFMSLQRIRTSSADELVGTLIHEKIHVYQRAHPAEMEEWLNQNEYTKASRVSDRAPNSRIRSNPDIGGYYFQQSGPAIYKSSTPDGITDVHNGGAAEHPYEQMAYKIAGAYSHMT